MASNVPDDFLRAIEDATDALRELEAAATDASESTGSVGGSGGSEGKGAGAGFSFTKLAKFAGIADVANLGRKAFVDSFNTSADFSTALTANIAETFISRTGIGKNTLDPINRAAQRTVSELGEAAQFGRLDPALVRQVQERNEALEANRQQLIAQVGGNRLESVRDATAEALAPLLDRLIGVQVESQRLLGQIANNGGGGAPG